jgi:cytosine/adenosine deaminase-related metal-dependent hydrolase
LIHDAGVLLTEGQPTIAGRFSDVLRIAKSRGVHEAVERPDLLALPGLVNAHVHFDLHVIGPRPYPGNFIHWLSMVIQARADAGYDPAMSVTRAIASARDAGHCAAGDIAGSVAAAQARIDAADMGLAGVSYLETLGFQRLRGKLASANTRRKIGRLRGKTSRAFPVSVGIEPHAAYSTNAAQFRRINQPRRVLRCTHLAETREEAEFVREAAGPFRELLKKLGRWDDGFEASGLSPVGWLDRLVPGSWSDWLLVHCNYVSDDDINLMARKGASVAYCPVASAYFGHVGHSYRQMIAAGVNVALGTDSAICQSPDDPDQTGLWAGVRLLYRRDGTNPQTLIAMAGINGARALGLQAWYEAYAPVTFVEIGSGGGGGDLLERALGFSGRSFDGWSIG